MSELRRECRAPKVANTKCKSRGDRSKPARLLPRRVSQFSPPTPSSRDRSIYGLFSPERISFYRALFSGKRFSAVRPVRRVGIFFLEAISPWWSRSQNHRIFLFQTFPGTQSGESGMFPYHFVEMVLGWRASFPFPNSKLVAVRKFKKSEKGRCYKRDHKRAVPKFKKVYLTKKLPGKNYPWCKVFRPEKPCRKNYPTCKLFHIPY